MEDRARVWKITDRKIGLLPVFGAVARRENEGMKHTYLKTCLFSLALTFGLFVCMTRFSPAYAQGFAVTTTSDSGPGSLRQALINTNLAPGPDTITFAITGEITIGSPLPSVQGDVLLQGPGADQLMLRGSYLYRLFDVRAGAAMTIADLTLTEGRAPNGEAGGAIRSYGALTLQRVHLSNNLSVSAGGAIYVKDGPLQIADSLIQSNTAGTNGGIYVGESIAAITETVFAYNQGSAIQIYRAPTVHMSDTRVLSNTGCGLDAEHSNVYLSNVHILGNSGGGIATHWGQLSVERSIISGNRAGNGAGINVDGTTILTDTVLMDNQARNDGGALYQSMFSDGLTITGGVIANNRATNGAGIYLLGGGMHVQAASILNNYGSRGAALYLWSMGDALITDSCIAHNRASSGLAVETGQFNSYYLTAPNNWWGAEDGPSGAGTGSGDSIDKYVIYGNFKTSMAEGCPALRTAQLYLPAVNK